MSASTATGTRALRSASPWGTVGKLCVWLYSLMQGYDKKPEETTAVVDAEGWLHTGDVVTMRDDGTIRFLGRHKTALPT